MPSVEVSIVGSVTQSQKGELAKRLTEVFTTPDIPADWVTMVFRQIDPTDYAIAGRFIHASDKSGAETAERAAEDRPIGSVMLNVTIGALDEGEKRRIAVGISDALTAIGVPERHIKIYFRHVTGRDIAEGGGVFTFRPPGSVW